MANINDYLVWRGELSMAASPWNAVDGLLIATLSYLNFHGIQDARGWTLEEAKRIDLLIEGQNRDTEYFQLRRTMFSGMADSVRFGQCRMHHFLAMTDETRQMQFSAMCVDMPDGTMCVAFRGTDNTLTGWREDFNMAYQTRVPGQEAAGYYLSLAAEATDRPLRIIGHSKGGNLAVYAAAVATDRVQERIRDIWTYDGPGMNREMSSSEGFLRIKDRIHSYIPQTSIIGLLMDYYQPYTVVRSSANGLGQHDPMTWQVYGGRFEELESIDRTASVICQTLHEWLQNSTPEQRGAFVDALFQMADRTKATRITEMSSEKFRSLWKMVGARKEMDPETRRIFTRLMAQAVTLGFGSVMERVRGRKDEDVEGRYWETMIPEDEPESSETLKMAGGFRPPVKPSESFRTEGKRHSGSGPADEGKTETEALSGGEPAEGGEDREDRQK